MKAVSHGSYFAAAAAGRAGERRRPVPARAVPRPEQEQSHDVSNGVKSVVAGALAAPLLLLVSGPARARPVAPPGGLS